MKRLYSGLIFVLMGLSMMVVQDVRASHALGADISYTCVGPNTYDVVVSFYRDCDGISAPTSIILEYSAPSCGFAQQTLTLTASAGCTNAVGQCCGQQLPGVCGAQQNNTTCNNGTYPGVEITAYCGTITLPGQCSEWIIGYAECCRNSAVTNLQSASSYDQYVYSIINNTSQATSAGCNNSPFFTNNPSELFCAGYSYCYNHGAVDIDGDSLVFSLINPLDDFGVPINYSGGLSPTNPMQVTPGSFSFDPTTGQICFEPSTQQAAVITVLVEEYRNINGVPTLVGATTRDIQFQVLSSGLCSGSQPSSPAVQNPVGAGIIDSVSVQLCPGNTVTFDVVSFDPDGNIITMTSNVGTAIPGASFNIGPATPDTFAIGQFSWAPGPGDAGLHFFTVTVTNDACPVPSSSTQTIKVNVYEEVTIATSSVAFCGDSVQLNAIGGSMFTWQPTTGMSNPNIPNPKVAPATPTWYKVISDCGEDSVFIDVTPPYTLDAGNDTSICLNSLAQLNAAVSGAGSQGNFAPMTYTWTPAGPLVGLDSSDRNIANPLVSPPAGQNYIVTVENAQGCRQRDTVFVGISGVAPDVTALVSPDTVCPGGTVQLDVSASPTACGASTRPCVTSNVTYDLGTSTNFNTSNTAYPAIYGHYWKSARHQMLYKASEFQAQGLSGGTITSIAVNVAQLNGTNRYCEFTIKLGCASLQNMTSNFQGGLTQVFTPKTVYLNNTGWQTYVLDTPYDWDGVSDLIVDICYNRSTGSACDSTFSRNSQNFYTTTPFVSVVYENADGSNQCPVTTGTVSSNRPNLRFGICQQGIAPGAVISWTPSNLITGNPNDNNPLAQIYSNTTFIVNVDEGGCVGQSSVNTYVNDDLTLSAGPDTSLCVATPITLTAQAIGVPSPIILGCGVNGTACGGAATNHTIGNNTTTTNQSTPYSAEDATRIQMLYTANELAAGGALTGIISNLAFNVTAKSSTGPFQNFTISIGCSNDDSLTTFVTGLDVVYGPVSATTTAGWNTYTLTAPYDWDGFSNLIVEVSWDNGLGGAVNGDIVQATNSGFSSTHYQTSFFGIPNPAVTTNIRPDVRLGICPPPPGTFTYQWTPSTGLTDPITGLPTDTGQTVIANVSSPIDYVVEVTDGNCVAYDTVTVNFYSSYNANMRGSNIGCAGASDGDLISTPTGGNAPYDFTWSDGTNVIQTTTAQLSDTVVGLTAGTYYLTLSDNNACQSFDTVTLTVPPPLVIDTIFGTDITCNGFTDGTAGVVALDGTPPYTYSWSSGDSTDTLSSLTAGTYVITVTDSSGCQVLDSVTLIEPAPITYVTDSTATSCFQGADGSASVVITGGGSGNFTYLWSNGGITPTITGLTAGTYAFTVSDVAGACGVEDSVIVEEPDSFIITTTLVADVSCFNTADGQATADVGGVTAGYTFDWSSGETGPTAIALSAGINTVTVTVDSSGCTQTATINIGAPARFFLTTDSTEVSCPGGSDGTATVTVTGSGGTPPFTYNWSNGFTTATITGLTADSTYRVTVTDANGCEEYDTVSITGPAPFDISYTAEPAACFGANTGSAQVTVSGATAPYTYAWSTGATTDTASGLAQGTYAVTITDANGCVDSLNNIVVTQPTNPLDVDTTLIDVSCPENRDGAIFLEVNGGTGPYLYSVDGGATFDSTPNFNLLSVGDYDIVVIDSNNCEYNTTVTLTAPPAFEVSFIPEQDTINLGDSLVLTPLVEPWDTSFSYSWQPANTLSCDSCENPAAMPVVTTVYEVSVFDENNCRQSTRFTLYVENDKKLYVPNVFTPNADGLNDQWEIFIPGAKSLTVGVFNRWGEKVFYSDGPIDATWDGYFKGKLLPPDVYVYYIEVVYLDDQKTALKGSVLILK